MDYKEPNDFSRKQRAKSQLRAENCMEGIMNWLSETPPKVAGGRTPDAAAPRLVVITFLVVDD